MGGYGAIVFALRNPEYFGTAFALSPSVTSEGKAPPDILKTGLENNFPHVYGNPFSQEKWDELGYNSPYKSYLAQDSKIRFFVATGTDDTITPVADSRDFVANLKRDKIEYLYKEIPSGNHSWGFWSQMLYPALEYIGKYSLMPTGN